MKLTGRKNKNFKLVYFRSYSDFSYSINGNFSVEVAESDEAYTEFWVSDGKDKRCVMIIKQTSLRVFHDVSPEDLLTCIIDRLLESYAMSKCESFDNLDTILINILLPRVIWHLTKLPQ